MNASTFHDVADLGTHRAPRCRHIRTLAMVAPRGAAARRRCALATLLAALGSISSTRPAPASPPPAATTAPSPAGQLEPLLEQVRAAVGAERLAARGVPLEAHGRGALAGVDTAWQLTLFPDGSAIQRFQGPLSYGSATHGGRTWLIDLGGEVREALEMDREIQTLGFLIFDHRWLSKDGPLRLRLAESTDGDPGTISVAFDPQHGRVGGTIEIDAATALPRRWRFGLGPEQTTIELADWHDHDGVRIPGRLETNGAGGASGLVKVERVADAPGARVEQLVPPAPSATDVRFDPSLPAAVEIVRSPTGHLLVHPRVDGQDVGWFIFDSGAGMNVLATSAIAQLGLETFGAVPANGIGGRTAAHFCRPASLSLGAATVERPLMVGLDLAFLDQPMGRKIGGLVGFGFLARVVARLDLRAPSLELHDPGAFDGRAMPWQRLVLDQRLPHVDAAFALPPLRASGHADAGGDASSAAEGRERVHRGLFRLDTGAASSTVSMHEPAVRELRLLEGLDTSDSTVGGVGGRVPVKRGRLAWFELGGVRTDTPKAEFALEARGAFADPGVLGNIGGELLLPFTLVFDYPHGRIAFLPKEAESDP